MKLSLSVLVSTLVIVFLQFVAIGEALAVLGGKPVTVRDTDAASAVVIVELLDSKYSFRTICTGTVIGKNTVLTAGHCFDPKVVKDVTHFNIIFETTFSTFGARNLRRGLKWTVHPSYRKPAEWDFDVAVVTFEGALPANVVPASLETDRQLDFGGVTAMVYGYGRSKPYTGIEGENRWDSVGTLRRSPARVDSDYLVFTNQYYLSGSSNVACQGDSGGPQFYTENGKTKILGITSANIGTVLPNGIQNCDQGSLVIKASSVASWVAEAQKKLSRSNKK